LELRINFAHYDANFTTCDAVTVQVSGIDGLEYSGAERWEITSDTLAPAFLTRLEATAPPNDTSGLIVTMGCGEHQSNYPTYFITTADTVRTLGSNPREHPRLPTEEERRQNRLKDYERAKREWEERQEQLRRFKGKSTTGPVMNPKDSALVDSLSDKGKRQLGRMRMLERSPLTDQERQWIVIDNRWFVRERGETKFRRVEGRTDEQIRADAQRYWDSLAANPPDSVYDVILDLRDPDDYDFAKSLLERLLPTDSVGFFRAVMNRPTLMKLTNRGIKFWRSRCWPEPCVPKRDKTQAPVKGGKDMEHETDGGTPMKEGREILFFEGFESEWPGQWDVGDDDPGNGYDYWGDVYDCYFYSGWWSGWCADVGDMPSCQYYDDNMWAYMEMTVPVDLTQHVNTQLSFKVHYDTEPEYDYFEVYGSTDGFIWVLIQPRFTGNSGGWDEIAVPIPSGGNYYVRFLFISDYSYSNYGGVYLDDIEVTGVPSTQPNLTWYCPPFWDWPIVPSSDSCTNTVNTLYGGEHTYIDWSMANNGDADAGPFHVALYLDDVLLKEWSFGTLWWGYYHNYEDYKTTISTGYHTLKLWVDNRKEVEEIDENDNVYERGFTWLTP